MSVEVILVVVVISKNVVILHTIEPIVECVQKKKVFSPKKPLKQISVFAIFSSFWQFSGGTPKQNPRFLAIISATKIHQNSPCSQGVVN